MLCLGEALVDLICERAVEDLTQADAFVPRFGGTVANVAVSAARGGARVALAGGAGDDAWGFWVRQRLASEGVDVSLFSLVADVVTRLALVSVDYEGEAHYHIYGGGTASVLDDLPEQLEQTVSGSAALFLCSNTLVEPRERAITMRARELALAAGRPVIFDPNLRLHRWRSRADAAASANACVPGALLVRTNAGEASVMTGEIDPERAALALVKAGARLVVITLGAEGAILRGELRADVPGVRVEVVSTIGAGDVLTGTLLASLARTDFYPASVAAALPEAVAASARACQRWGAFD
jgi:fructokinase